MRESYLNLTIVNFVNFDLILKIFEDTCKITAIHYWY